MQNSNQNPNSNRLTLFITGGGGYVGAMLADQFSQRSDVKEIICLDKNEIPALLNENKKVYWINDNTSNDTWQEKVSAKKPDIIIHTAWQIREMFGQKEKQWKWNVLGSENVFNFAFKTPSVKKLVHFSTASSYGAFSGNTLEHFFKEDEMLKEDEYLYGIEKKVAEEILRKKFEEAKTKNVNHIPQIFIVRPAALTGPRGRFMMNRFGLQKVLRNGLPIIPIANKIWCRQFIHEDDVVDIISMLSFENHPDEYEVFNITPNSIVLAKDMAEVMGKRTFRITPTLVRIAFFIFWHLSRGRIPTSKGGWKFYSFPIVMDGSKLTNKYGYKYKYQSREALEKIVGRYAKYVHS